VLLAVWLAVTVCVVVVLHDVHTLSGQSTSNRASLNRTFAALATSILDDENRYGTEALTLLATGSTLTRATLAGQMSFVSLQGRELEQRTALLARPVLDDNVQATLATVTTLRVGAVSSLLQRIGIDLGLPHKSAGVLTTAEIQGVIEHSNELWATARTKLVKAPGRAHLPSSVFALATAPIDAQMASLQSAATLTPERAVTISAVAVTPAPFPAPRFDLVLPPVASVAIDVVVHNIEYINQIVTVRVVLHPYSHANKTEIRQVSIKLGPLGARALAFSNLAVKPNEHAVVTISLTGAPIAVGGSGSKKYHLYVASAPTS
jgi:hypothetical protein